MRGMQSDSEKLRTKSAFLLLNLLTSHPEHKDAVLSMGMVQQLVSVLRSPHSSVHEHVLGALCCLVEDAPRGVSDCRDPSLGLEELLNQRVQDLRGREESLEELGFCERLRVACFQGQPQDDNGMDR
ncbi:hsp70-binding protein 1-like [Sinocyclocheilus grahami]|uniref:hsp70-binding protein 1-like n=1 Tax=Sinocyclocheilus grahami TaxID=75366 RepID=UPI0007ACECAF|nr:PREDICTED: hsp70-binding protein 1-like [Sinocyclocheilus grahami]